MMPSVGTVDYSTNDAPNNIDQQQALKRFALSIYPIKLDLSHQCFLACLTKQVVIMGPC